MDPSVASRRPLRVALLGLGTVGRPTAARLIDGAWRARVAGRGVVPPELVAVGLLDPDRPRGIELLPSIQRTDDLDALVVAPQIDVVVELLGGVERAAVLVERALGAGKAVVTANKALLARRGPALEAAARAAGVALRFEAAVAAGIPILTPLAHDLAANRVAALRGIVNGTTNFILSAMAHDGWTYDEALQAARDSGYAEADATADVEGFDAAEKLAVLSRLAFGVWLDVDAIRRRGPAMNGDGRPGITGVRPLDLRVAADLGLSIRLVAEARGGSVADEVAASVMPVAVDAASPLGATNGVTNHIEVAAEPVGVVSFSGPGAGGPTTSSAVLGDLLALSRGEGSTWGPGPGPSRGARVMDLVDHPRSWFVVRAGGFAEGASERLESATVRRSPDGTVTRILTLEPLRIALREMDMEAAIYPVLDSE